MHNELAREWFFFADKDLDSAEVLLEMRPQHYEIICFHCQQSAEKYLKGYLIFKGIEQPPKTHDLQLLLSLCREQDPSFIDIADECEILTQFGVLPRYPDGLELDDYHTKRALECATKVKDFAALVDVRTGF